MAQFVLARIAASCCKTSAAVMLSKAVVGSSAMRSLGRSTIVEQSRPFAAASRSIETGSFHILCFPAEKPPEKHGESLLFAYS